MNHRRSIAVSLFLLAGLVAFAWQQEGWKTPPVVPHALEGRDNCMMCHKAGAMEPVPDAPADHEGRDNQYCTLCHVAAA